MAGGAVMEVDILANVKLSLDGTTYRYKGGVQDVPQAVGELLVKGGLAASIAKPVKQEAQKAQPKREEKPATAAPEKAAGK